MSRKTKVVALILLITFSSGCSRQLRTLLAQGLNGADGGKDARTLSKEAYELIVKNDYDGAIRKAELPSRKIRNLLRHTRTSLLHIARGTQQAFDGAKMFAAAK